MGWKDNVYFVLVGPREAGNIGAAARAVKNMGFSRLVLVAPKKFPSDEAFWFAHSAEDVLKKAKVVDTLKEAIDGMSLVVGTSRRAGKKRGLTLGIEDGAGRISAVCRSNKVAVLFGREDKGLDNTEAAECGFLVRIPTDRRAPSMNLAQAVLIVAYELSKRPAGKSAGLVTGLVTKEEFDRLMPRVEAALLKIGYFGRGNEEKELRTRLNIRHMIGRAGLTEWELKMLHGICGRIEGLK